MPQPQPTQQFAIPTPDEEALQQQPGASQKFAIPTPEEASPQPTATPTKYGFSVTPTTTYNGKTSFKREGDNGVWYGPDQGNQGKAGWFDDKGMRLGSTPGASLPFFSMDQFANAKTAEENKPAPAPTTFGQNLQTAATQAGNKSIFSMSPTLALGPAILNAATKGTALEPYTPNPTYAGVAHGVANDVLGPVQSLAHAVSPISNAPANTMDRAVNATQGYFDRNYDQSKSGEFVGQLLPFLLGDALAGEGAVAQPLTMGQKLLGMGKSTMVGAGLNPLITPEAYLTTPDDYANRKKKEAAVGAAGGAFFGALPLATEVMPAIRKSLTGYKGEIAPELPAIASEAPVAGVEAMIDTPINIPPTPNVAPVGNDILATANPERTVQEVAMNLPGANQELQNLNLASGNKFNTKLSLGDITQDPQVMELEKNLEGKTGSGVNAFRTKQGQDLNLAITQLENGNGNIEAGKSGESGWKAPTVVSESGLPESSHTFQTAGGGSHSIEVAAANGDADAARILNMVQKAKTPNDEIQASLNGQAWAKKQQANELYKGVSDKIDAAVAANPTLPENGSLLPRPNTLDVGPINETIASLRKGINGLAPDADTIAVLDRVKPEGITNYQGAKSVVSQLEQEAQRLGAGGNRVASTNIGRVARTIDAQADAFAEKMLPGDNSPQLASDYFRDNVVPYLNNDTGIPKIMKGEYTDLANKRLFAVDSPDQFKTIFDALDPKGQDALRYEMLDRARTAGTNGNKQPFDLQAWSRYVKGHGEQFGTAFRDSNGAISDPELLAHLISQLPRAGQNSPTQNLLTSNPLAKFALGGAGLGHGGINQGLLGLGAELGGEVGLNATRGRMLMNPNLGALSEGSSKALPGDLTAAHLKYKIPIVIHSTQEFNALPSGAVYVDSQGNKGVKP